MTKLDQYLILMPEELFHIVGFFLNIKYFELIFCLIQIAIICKK